MECCFAPQRKNKPPTSKQYEPFEPTNVSRVRVLVPNDTNSVNQSIEHKQKSSRLVKMNLKFQEEAIPFPPRTVKVSIAM